MTRWKFRIALVSVVAFLIVGFSQSKAEDDVCKRWFEKSKINRAAKDCETRCSGLGSDMGTFHCPDQCDRLCRPDVQCKSAKSFWSPRIRADAPADWPNKLEKSKAWATGEAESVLDALSKLPRVLWSDSIQGVYRMEKSKDAGNPATGAGHRIVLYDEAFISKGAKLGRVIAHELAHELWDGMGTAQKRTYMLAGNWSGKSVDTGPWISRQTGYVEEDGRTSPWEDFANNIEFYLFQPESLKSATPAAFGWIEKRFGSKFEIGGGCESL